MIRPSCTLRHTSVLVFTLLVIEFFDEFAFGVREAAWPLIRTDLGLSYAQIGLLLGVPGVVSGVVEPFLGVLDQRRHFARVGGTFGGEPYELRGELGSCRQQVLLLRTQVAMSGESFARTSASRSPPSFSRALSMLATRSFSSSSDSGSLGAK